MPLHYDVKATLKLQAWLADELKLEIVYVPNY